ncbi:hypothetical protein COCMIDRAFT_104214, partial [Bipolaris oryzae ATCC 44560]
HCPGKDKTMADGSGTQLLGRACRAADRALVQWPFDQARICVAKFLVRFWKR